MTLLIDLQGKKGLVVGIANAQSIAYGCAKAFQAAGAQLALTYVNEKTKTYTEPLFQELKGELFLPCDVMVPGQLEAVFETVQAKWGQLDFLVHSIAFAPKADLQGRLTDVTKAGFLQAMEVSCYSFIQMAKLAEPLMKQGGCLLTMTYYGSQRVIPHYNLMGPVKATLESVVRYLASELGPQKIRVNAISPGPLLTRAASGLTDFDQLMENAKRCSPSHELVETSDVGHLAAFLVSPLSKGITGETHYIDAGAHISGY